MLSERITVKDHVPAASKKKRKKLPRKNTLTLLTTLQSVTTFCT